MKGTKHQCFVCKRMVGYTYYDYETMECYGCLGIRPKRGAMNKDE